MMTLQQMRALTLEQLTNELPEARFGRGIFVDRTNEECGRSAFLAGIWETAKRECKDPERLASAEEMMRRQTRELLALWGFGIRPD